MQPTVRKDFLEICRQLGGLPGLRTLGITTNGIKLERQLPELMAAGVNALNISLDTLVPAKFQFITRRTGFERVHGAITAALAAGFPSVKLNCVVMRGVNDDEIVDFVALTRDWPVHVRMIEYMPFDSNAWSMGKFVPAKEMMAKIRGVWPTIEAVGDDAHETARLFRVPGYAGKFGIISSMTEQFCATCSRLRITADGQLKVCLFDNSVSELGSGGGGALICVCVGECAPDVRWVVCVDVCAGGVPAHRDAQGCLESRAGGYCGRRGSAEAGCIRRPRRHA